MNIERLRADTPGCHGVVHLNNAGAALSPLPVTMAVTDHLELEGRLGGYEAEAKREAELEAVYASLARLVGARPQEMAMMQNATRAWDMIFYAAPLLPGDRILTCRSEYASNYIAFLQRARQTGAEIVVIDDAPDGTVSLESLRRLLDERVKVVAINHVPTNSGLVQPAAAIGRLLADHPALYLLDACQSVGQLPISVTEIGCDALSATSRKFLRGPRGLGFLFVKEALIETIEPPFLDLHAARWTHADRYEVRSDARRFESWESFVAGRLGLGAAAEYAMSLGLTAIWERLRNLGSLLRRSLAQVPGARVHDRGDVLGAIVTFTLEGVEPEMVAKFLGDQGINVWTSSVFSARLDMEARNLPRVVRASPHYYNTEQEIALLVDALKRCRALT